MTSQDSELKLIQDAVDKLIEHFDCVQVFATRQDESGAGGTVNINIGAGNWYARYGQVCEWKIKQDELARVNMRESP